MIPTLLLPASQILIESIEKREQLLEITLSSQTTIALCPDCKTEQNHVHSRYIRKAGDLPWAAFTIKLQLIVRRFFCYNEDCSRKTFAERLSFLSPYARRTARLNERLTSMAFATSAQAGSRLSALFAMPVSSSTMLRLMHGYRVEPAQTPSVLGVDDFAFCKRKNYGTILVDNLQGQVIDLLPDRLPETLSDWLKMHPEIEYITRDRAAAYGEGSTKGAPQAIQVADRWHLLVNLSDALKRFLDGQASALYQAGMELAQQAIDETPAPESKEAISIEEKPPSAKEIMFEKVKELAAKGYSGRAISRLLSLSRVTVSRYLQHQMLPAYPTRKGGTKFTPFIDFIAKHWQEGNGNRYQLYLLLKEQGYKGCYGNLCKFLNQYPKQASITPKPIVVPIASRKTAMLLSRLADDLSEKQQKELRVILDHCPKAAAIHPLVLEFVIMVRNKQSQLLDDWLQKASNCQVAGIASFAKGLTTDYEAVKAALQYSHSNGPVEGQVNRLKLIKRQAYGRAGFNLLRKRVLVKI
ncbi:ISL3 family transposase [Rhodocytophaga rosea]|uniref:ISL3 family transposase n=1 Tax=Rhodocytophaga rosea TaxID=2704465 RepID=A0A6C0GI43_9BACT|nr:ISL3 family transposase [Rhodocytophaga rosea]QHT67363.1 ISL3 family transposase [Rhodocytophaga rosea]